MSSNETFDTKLDGVLLDLVHEISSIRVGKTFAPIDYTEPAKQAIIALVHKREVLARVNILKQLWNTTQPDLIPEGVPALDMSEELHRLVAELTKSIEEEL